MDSISTIKNILNKKELNGSFFIITTFLMRHNYYIIYKL